jgi:hypothetical protein
VTTKALIPAMCMQLYIVIDLITALGNDRIRVYFNVQFYTKCAVLNPFVQFLKHQCAVIKRTKVALKQLLTLLALKQSSHLPLWMLQKIPEMLSSHEHKKYKRFLGEDPQTLLFSSQITYVLG